MIKIHSFPVMLVLLMMACMASAQPNVNSIPVPNKQQLAWQQAELGVVFHYDLHVFDTSKYNQSINRISPVADYNIFNPQQLDVAQWVPTAKDLILKKLPVIFDIKNRINLVNFIIRQLG